MIKINHVWFQLSDGLRNWFNSNIKDEYPKEVLQTIRLAFKKAGFADTDTDISLEREYTLHYFHDFSSFTSEYINISYNLHGYINNSYENMRLDPKPIFDKEIKLFLSKGNLACRYDVNIFPIRIARITNAILQKDQNLTVVDAYYCLPEEIEPLKQKMQEIAEKLLDDAFKNIKYFGSKDPTSA